MRLLFLLQPGANSRSIFLDMMSGFESAGHEIRVMEIGPIWGAFGQDGAAKAAVMTQATAQLAAAIKRERIDAVVGMWANALLTFMNSVRYGVPVTAFDVIGVPILNVWLDAPHWANNSRMFDVFGQPILRSPAQLNLINNAATAREMSEVLGFGNVFAQPYGVNERIFHPRTAGDPRFDMVASVGPGDPEPTDTALAMLDSDAPEMPALRRSGAGRIGRKLEKLVAGRADAALLAPLLTELLDAQLADRHEPMLSRLDRLRAGDDPAAASLRGDPRLFVRATMLIREVEAMERAFTVSWLSRRVRMATFGSGDLSRWGCRASNLGELRYEAMPDAYAQAPIGLNVMRWQDDAGVNIKPFEITASGAACLCVNRRGLETLFHPGREIAAFEGPVEALAQARALLGDPANLRALAQAGLERCRGEHTWAHRVAGIVREIEVRRGAMGAP